MCGIEYSNCDYSPIYGNVLVITFASPKTMMTVPLAPRSPAAGGVAWSTPNGCHRRVGQVPHSACPTRPRHANHPSPATPTHDQRPFYHTRSPSSPPWTANLPIGRNVSVPTRRPPPPPVPGPPRPDH